MDKYTDLPIELQKKVKKADQFIIDRQKAKEAGTPPPAPPVEPIIEPPPVEPIVEPSIEPPVEPPVIEPPSIPKTYTQEEYDRLQQEYSSLKGKYDKEPAELQRQVNFLTEQVLKLTEIKETPPPMPVVPPKPIKEVLLEMPEFKALKDNMVPEAFEALLAGQERIYNLALEKAQERANQTIVQEVGKVDAKFAQTAEQRFWADFNREYSDWVTIKASPEFQQFVNEEDPLTGISKYAIIKDAFDRRDLGRVIKFLDIATGKKKLSVVPPVSNPAAVQDKLKGKVAPPVSSGPPVSTVPPTKMTVAEATKELTNMAQLKNRGLWKGTQDEYVKRDATLRKIINVGSRVQP